MHVRMSVRVRVPVPAGSHAMRLSHATVYPRCRRQRHMSEKENACVRMDRHTYIHTHMCAGVCMSYAGITSVCALLLVFVFVSTHRSSNLTCGIGLNFHSFSTSCWHDQSLSTFSP